MKLFITTIGFLLLSACSVTNTDIKQSEFICEKHMGVSEISIDGPDLVTCVDGTKWFLTADNLKGMGD